MSLILSNVIPPPMPLSHSQLFLEAWRHNLPLHWLLNFYSSRGSFYTPVWSICVPVLFPSVRISKFTKRNIMCYSLSNFLLHVVLTEDNAGFCSLTISVPLAIILPKKKKKCTNAQLFTTVVSFSMLREKWRENMGVLEGKFCGKPLRHLTEIVFGLEICITNNPLIDPHGGN